MPSSLSDCYEALVQSGRIERDPAQQTLVNQLERLNQKLADHRLSRKSSALGWLFARKKEFSTKDTQQLKGLYIWGGVGRGKSMLMDLFFNACPVRRKRRVHFHAFMAEVHEGISHWRNQAKTGQIKGDDPILHVASAIIEQSWLLCFDEFTVTDITDAMLLSRLFTVLFAKGVVVVATSNVEPARLYENGLNRALFVPFIGLLQRQMEIFKLQARTDFRLEKLGRAPVYYTPVTQATREALDDMFYELTGLKSGKPVHLNVKGHDLMLPQTASGVARASFAELCEKPYAASDYLALAQNYHTLILDDVPQMAFEKRNEAKRFIMLIDALYEAHVKLVMSADVEAQHLYKADHGREAFEFERTVSRLFEMRSDAYLALPHGLEHSQGSGNTSGLVET